MTTTWYRGGRIFTADPDAPWAESLVVSGDTLVYVGDDSSAGAHAGDDVVELDGALVLPGFIDAHTHLLMLGDALAQLELADAKDVAEVQDRLRGFAAEHPDAPRLLGTSWLYSALDGEEPHREMIDAAIPDRPVYLAANDLHSSWVNSAALAELGSTPTPRTRSAARSSATPRPARPPGTCRRWRRWGWCGSSSPRSSPRPTATNSWPRRSPTTSPSASPPPSTWG